MSGTVLQVIGLWNGGNKAIFALHQQHVEGLNQLYFHIKAFVSIQMVMVLNLNYDRHNYQWYVFQLLPKNKMNFVVIRNLWNEPDSRIHEFHASDQWYH